MRLWKSLFVGLLAALALALTGTGPASASTSASLASGIRHATIRPMGLVWLPGGCAPGTKGPFTASACDSSGGFLGVDMYSDAYIDAKPSGCFSYEIDIRNVTSAVIAAGGWHTFCGTGHLGGPTYSGSKTNQPYYSELTIVSGSLSYVFDGPYIGYQWQ
jgi:hypothetical protein